MRPKVRRMLSGIRVLGQLCVVGGGLLCILGILTAMGRWINLGSTAFLLGLLVWLLVGVVWGVIWLVARMKGDDI